MNVEGRYQTKEVWRDNAGQPLHPHTNYYVGGNTKFYGAALFRLRKEDFGELRHHGGVSPACPISYGDLEPYYLKAENLYHVHGERGIDPTEPLASGPYPHPPVGHEPAFQRPGVVVSADILNNGHGGLVVVAPVTTTGYGLRSHVELEPEDGGLDHTSYARCDQLRVVSTERLTSRQGMVGPAAMRKIDEALLIVLDL